jgi:hypothetical protein
VRGVITIVAMWPPPIAGESQQPRNVE